MTTWPRRGDAVAWRVAQREHQPVPIGVRPQSGGRQGFLPQPHRPQTTLVRIDRGEHTVGAIHFFATHGTSMTNRNRMISGDNKGFAAYHWERTVGGADYLAGQPDFIAAFAQTNPGDMSPNVDGPLPPGAAPQCALENTRQIGLRQFEDASTQLGATASIGSGIDARLTYVDLSSVRVRGEFTPDGQEHRTGSPTVGAGGMAGTEEGKGFQGFHQGQNLFWDKLSGAMYRFAGALGATQAPKASWYPRACRTGYIRSSRKLRLCSWCASGGSISSASRASRPWSRGCGYGAPWPRSSAPSWPTSCASATAMPTSIT